MEQARETPQAPSDAKDAHPRRAGRRRRHPDDRPPGALQLSGRRDGAGLPQGRAAARARSESPRGRPARRGRRLLQRRRLEVHPGRRRRARTSATSRPSRAGRRAGTARSSSRSWSTSTRPSPRSSARPSPSSPPWTASRRRAGSASRWRATSSTPRSGPTFEWAYGKTGLTGAESSTFFLPRLLGLRRAMELVLLNPRLDAKTAPRVGPRQRASCRRTASTSECSRSRPGSPPGPPRRSGSRKELVHQAAGVDRLDFHLDREIEQLARIADGRDFAEGLDSFFEKRPPRFSGKGEP